MGPKEALEMDAQLIALNELGVATPVLRGLSEVCIQISDTVPSEVLGSITGSLA
jgi:hypothetical protein